MPDNRLSPSQADKIIPLLRLMGVIACAMGLLFIFNVMNVGELVGLMEEGMHKYLGGILCIIGLIDILILPRIFEQISQKNRK